MSLPLQPHRILTEKERLILQRRRLVKIQLEAIREKDHATADRCYKLVTSLDNKLDKANGQLTFL